MADTPIENPFPIENPKFHYEILFSSAIWSLHLGFPSKFKKKKKE